MKLCSVESTHKEFFSKPDQPPDLPFAFDYVLYTMANTKIVEIVLAIGNVTVSDVSSTFRRYSLLRPPQEQGSRYPMRVIAVNQRFRSSGSFFFLRTVRKRIGAFLQGVKG